LPSSLNKKKKHRYRGWKKLRTFGTKYLGGLEVVFTTVSTLYYRPRGG
jgi:hypothetical protein